MDDRVVSSEEQTDDEVLESSIRPLVLDVYIGHS